MTALLQRLDKVAANLTPFVLALVLVMGSSVPIRLPTFGSVAPNLALIAVFYWTIYRPDLLPGVAVLSLGLWQDILVGAPFGLNAITLLLAHGAIVLQRTFFQGKSFLVIWWAFGLTAAVAATAFWLLTMGYHGEMVDPTPLLFQLALTTAVFPFFAWLFARVHHAILR